MKSAATVVGIIAITLEAGLLFRAWRERFLSQFPLFYSYVTYVLTWSLITFPIYFLVPRIYPSVYWFFYLMMITAEFAVIAEASDHIFSTYPMIRRLGRLLTGAICLFLFAVYVIPPLTLNQPSGKALIELYKRMSLTKAVLIIALLAVARLYKLQVGRNVSGLMLGFIAFLAVNIANASLVQSYGWAVYFKAYTLIEPLAFVLALSIWCVALWRYEPVLAARGRFSHNGAAVSDPLADRLGRYDAELSRLFRR
ncbi:MAG TPA: hypothetical protein VG028_16390 [Terriglobia bacterium]|nr:hypothetical protein [Terriglobia bacterium]